MLKVEKRCKERGSKMDRESGRERERKKERINIVGSKKKNRKRWRKKKLGTWKMERVSSLASHSTLYN